MTVDSFTKYAASSLKVRAHYTKVPIAELELFRKAFAKYGIFYKIRYRGPRAHRTSRNFYKRQSTCLKQDATHFSVYPY